MPDAQTLSRIHAERARIFRPAWFRDLLAGRLGLGDTFWIGTYGVPVVAVFAAAGLFCLLLILRRLPGLGGILDSPQPWLVALALLNAAYSLLLTRAVWIAARRCPEVGLWRWVGLALTALQAGLALLMLLVLTVAA